MKPEQFFYSLFNFNFHFQDVKKEISCIKEIFKDKDIKINSAIDLGCGDGYITKNIKDSLDIKEIYGLEKNKKLLKKAEERNINTIEGDMEACPVTNKFDLAVSYGSLHHSKDISNTIANMKKYSNKYILIVDNTVRDNLFHTITGSKLFPLELSPYGIRKEEDIAQALLKNKINLLAMKTNRNANIWHDRSFFLGEI